MWGVLKTYWELHADSPELINWLPPIHKMEPPEQITAPLKNTPIDILGLSCYTWNWRLQREIARQIKESHPDCLIIAGGPHPDYRNPSFFDENPWIDVVVIKHGEIPFNRILQRTLAYPTMRDFHNAPHRLDDIPGLCLPGRKGMLTSPPESPSEYSTSHYLAQKEYYEQFMRDHPNGVVAAWETSRGCPFSCSYCDWGSSTMSKVRQFDMKRINDEIEWFAKSGVMVVFSVDSNFGMFKSDVDITDSLVRNKERYGFPQWFVYSNAKNVPERTVEITRKVVGAGLETAHTLSIQHSSLEVLEATDRKNISIDKQIHVVRELQSDGIPISVQLILGLPLDTPVLWRKTFTDLMEWGIHDGYTVTNYHLLPNAPAASPEYRDRYKIQGLERYIYDGQGIRTNDPVDPLTYARGEVIVSTSTFTQDDWVQMSVEATCFRGLHNTGLTQAIARYLRCTHGIPYHEFYSDLLDSFLPDSTATADLMRTLSDCYQQFLADEDFLALLPLPEIVEANEHVEPHRWLFARICKQIDQFLDGLTDHLTERYPHIQNIESLCRYQRTIVVLPTFDALHGAQAETNHDWVEYFSRPSTIIPASPTLEPRPTPSAILSIQDIGWDDGTGVGQYDWQADGSHQSWNDWFKAIATNRLSMRKMNHQALCVHEQSELLEN